MPKGIKGFQKGHPYFSSGKNLFKKGCIPWNKGKKCPQLAGANNGFYGKKHSEETKMKNRMFHVGQGKPHTNESKLKLSLAHLGKEKHKKKGQTYEEVFGKERAQEIRKKQSKSSRLRGSNRGIKFPNKNSSIEVKIQNFLKELGIEFYTHQYIKEIDHAYQCDILIPIQKGIAQKVIIECDGDYWHANPKKYRDYRELNQRQKIQRILDYVRRIELEEKGFRVLRFWEREIKDLGINDLKRRLKS